jgi:hypothetical protein
LIWGTIAAWQLCSCLHLWSQPFDESFKLSLLPQIKLAITMQVVSILIGCVSFFKFLATVYYGVNKQRNRILREVLFLLPIANIRGIQYELHTCEITLLSAVAPPIAAMVFRFGFLFLRSLNRFMASETY